MLIDRRFSFDAVCQYDNEKKERFDRKKKMGSFLVKANNIKGNTKEIINSKVTEKDEECPVCQKSHQLENCLHFIKFSVGDGIKMLFKEK